MSQKQKKKILPHEIYLVESDSGFRIYTSEGQATNWALKEKISGKAKIHIYVEKETTKIIQQETIEK